MEPEVLGPRELELIKGRVLFLNVLTVFSCFCFPVLSSDLELLLFSLWLLLYCSALLLFFLFSCFLSFFLSLDIDLYAFVAAL
jgi:hypothetical protein